MHGSIDQYVNGRNLSEEQEIAIGKIICDQSPQQQQLAFVRWHCKAVMQLIARQYGITLLARCVKNYLRLWGLTAVLPTKQKDT
ncbi:MAG: winged helix-turn-helix domain-containing protein [Glaciimonas sp.]|nr:winged helix-turn-helix domain-containing protein [Glaciimonas sp.]